MGALMGYVIAAAVFCFVAGIILQRHGEPLRRVGLTLFALALLPSVAFGVLGEMGTTATSDGSVALLLLIAVPLVSAGAYLVLRLRTRGDTHPRRVAMKRPFTHRPDRDLLSFLREQMGRDE